MKSENVPHISILDALTTGLTGAGKHLWVVIVPVVMDLSLWSAPQFSIGILLGRLLQSWEKLVRSVYTPSQLEVLGSMLRAMREAVTQLGLQVNLADTVAGSWFGPPSIVATNQATRLTFISDMILAPAGLSLNLPQLASAPWRPLPIPVTSLIVALLITGLFWLVGQFATACYLRWAGMAWWADEQAVPKTNEKRQSARPIVTAAAPVAGAEPASSPGTSDPRDPEGMARWVGGRGFLGLAARLTVFGLVLGIVVFMLRLPFGVAATLLLMSGSTLAGILFVLVGGMTLWLLLSFLTSIYFTSETILFGRGSFWNSALQSVVVARSGGVSTLGLVLVINILLLGFRVVWGIIGSTPVGAALAILGNAYMVTGMVLAVFAYYGMLHKRWLAIQNQSRANGQRPPANGNGL